MLCGRLPDASATSHRHATGNVMRRRTSAHQVKHMMPRSERMLKPIQKSCSSSGFPCVGVRLVYSSLRCTATFVIRFHWALLLAFSLHFSSSSAFLRSLFTQSSHLSCGLSRLLQPSCFIVSNLLGISHLSF